jgi:hypothetical protein
MPEGDFTMFYNVGYPAGSVTNHYKILRLERRGVTTIALVRRTRRNQGLVTIVYVVVRSWLPILANGTVLNALEATKSGGRFEHKMRDPRMWMSDLNQAEDAFRKALRIGNPGRARKRKRPW